MVLLVAGWLNRHQLQAIVYLRAENCVLRDRIHERRLRFTDAERRMLALAGAPVGRAALRDLATLASPETVLRGYRDLVATKYALAASATSFTAAWVKPSFSSENRAPDNGPAAGERLAGAVERSLFLSPRRTERRPRACPRRRRRVGAGTLWSAPFAATPNATRATNPRKQSRQTRNPRGFLLEGFCETNPSELLRRGRLAPESLP
jgi:hypothetical protein